MNKWPLRNLGEVVRPRKEFIRIDDLEVYKRCRVQLHAKGIVLRDSVTGSELKTKEQQICRSGDFLVAEIDAKVGGYGIVPNELNDAIVSSHYFLFEVDHTRLDRYFLGYFIKTPYFSDQVSARGTTNYAAIRPSDVLEYQIPIPPLKEQRRIVAKIDELVAKFEEALSLRQQTTGETDALMDSVVGATFARLNHAKHKALGDLTTKIGSGSTPLGGRANYPLSGIPFIRSLNVRMRQFEWRGITFIDRETHARMNGTQVKPNDVLLNITGASIGRVACAPATLNEANVNQHVAIIRPGSELDSRYLMYWLSQPSVQEFINNEQKGATRQGFTKTQIERFRVPVLPIYDQRRIVAELDSLQAKVDILKRIETESNTEIEALLPSILDKAFKGEL
jgi:type I restriction enzyme S subunit